MFLNSVIGSHFHTFTIDSLNYCLYFTWNDFFFRMFIPLHWTQIQFTIKIHNIQLQFPTSLIHFSSLSIVSTRTKCNEIDHKFQKHLNENIVASTISDDRLCCCLQFLSYLTVWIDERNDVLHMRLLQESWYASIEMHTNKRVFGRDFRVSLN